MARISSANKANENAEPTLTEKMDGGRRSHDQSQTPPQQCARKTEDNSREQQRLISPPIDVGRPADTLPCLNLRRFQREQRSREPAGIQPRGGLRNTPSESSSFTPGISSITPTIKETTSKYSSSGTPTTTPTSAAAAVTSTINDVDSLLNCPHCDRTFTSRIGLTGYLRIHRTEAGEPVHGEPAHSTDRSLHCPHCPRAVTHCVAETRWCQLRNVIKSIALEALGSACRQHQDWFNDNDADISNLLAEKNGLQKAYMDLQTDATKAAFFRYRRLEQQRLQGCRTPG
ncbi:unnamed protein product [Schistocephalus solidus]|uniref:C2H2-type domain-containing protein n=1 Tax=Schistocephalus solidus TaxID=70667 RepID=A0A183T061_SCHSO|nr:unnamed protein product [Schistocephalus solidus]